MRHVYSLFLFSWITFPLPYQVTWCPVNTCAVLRVWKLARVTAITRHSSINNRPADKKLNNSAARKHNSRPVETGCQTFSLKTEEKSLNVFAECSNRKNSRKSHYRKFVFVFLSFFSKHTTDKAQHSGLIWSFLLGRNADVLFSIRQKTSCSGAKRNWEQTAGPGSRRTAQTSAWSVNTSPNSMWPGGLGFSSGFTEKQNSFHFLNHQMLYKVCSLMPPTPLKGLQDMWKTTNKWIE